MLLALTPVTGPHYVLALEAAAECMLTVQDLPAAHEPRFGLDFCQWPALPIKPFLFADDNRIYTENPEDSTNTTLKTNR